MARRLGFVFAGLIFLTGALAGSFVGSAGRAGHGGHTAQTVAASSPNWAEIVAAVGSVLTGATLLVGLGTVFIALRELDVGLRNLDVGLQALDSSRRDRHVAVIAEFQRRWADERLETARTTLYSYDTARLKRRIHRFLTTPGPDAEVEVLLRVPTFFEDLALLVSAGGVDDLELVWRAFWGPARQYWLQWEDTIHDICDTTGDHGAFTEYHQLVTEMTDSNPAFEEAAERRRLAGER
jgi:hypothetical protein